MPRAALRFLLVVVMGGLATDAAGLDPHLDPALVPAGCPACHRGHGLSRSPMLPAPQKQVCLACHDTQAKLDQQVLRGAVGPGARPPLLSSVLMQPFTHPVSDQAFSERDDVTCSSCHSPHRQMSAGRADPAPTGRRYLSPKNPSRFEVELCESCHGNQGRAGQSLLDISHLLNPANRSFHPVEAPSMNPSPSVQPGLSGREINCTDCHGSNDAAGPRGPHGSANPFVLRRAYATVDGAQESVGTYSLCYGCHRREAILGGSSFPEHDKHIVEERTSCATCHNPHGSVGNRALIRFGEEALASGVAPSPSTGRLEFLSTGPGSGACYLSCHGEDHAPETYGGFVANEGLPPGTPALRAPPALPPATAPRPPRRPPARFEPPR